MIPPNFSMKEYFNLKGILNNKNNGYVTKEETFIYDAHAFTSYKIKNLDKNKCSFEDIKQLTKSKIGYQVIKDDQADIQEINILYAIDTNKAIIDEETNQILKKCF
jgi:hypothetical protein